MRPDADGAPALIIARYPSLDAARLDDDAERMMLAVQDFIRGVRNIRAEKRVDAGRFVEGYIVGAEAADASAAFASEASEAASATA